MNLLKLPALAICLAHLCACTHTREFDPNQRIEYPRAIYKPFFYQDENRVDPSSIGRALSLNPELKSKMESSLRKLETSQWLRLSGSVGLIGYAVADFNKDGKSWIIGGSVGLILLSLFIEASAMSDLREGADVHNRQFESTSLTPVTPDRFSGQSPAPIVGFWRSF